MLQFETAKLIKASDENQHGLNLLQLKMQQSMTALESIQHMLNISTTPIKDTSNQLEQECSRIKLELLDSNEALRKKTDLVNKTQIQVDELNKSLESLSTKYDTDMKTWNKKYSDTKEDLDELTRDYDELCEKNNSLQEMLDQIKEVNESESKRKDLLLREGVQEQKILTQNVLERDHQIEEMKDMLKQLESKLDEKVDELNSKAGIEEECLDLQEKVVRLEEENTRCKKRLENLNELYNHKQLQEEEEVTSNKSIADGTDNHSHEDILDVETEWIQSNSIDNTSPLKTHHSNNSKSRIPVLTSGSMSKSASHITSEQMNMMKEDLLLYQEKLVEKISQNRELENAMDRMNEHCTLLRKSLNMTREESADRYRKMMKYMEENRILRERLDELTSS